MSDWFLDLFLQEPLFRLTVAALLALPIAWHRERYSRLAGLRTFPLVSMGACAYVLVGVEMLGSAIEQPEPMARIIQGLLSGIGFIGGGAILKNQNSVVGTASAASIWITGAVGAATGLGFWRIAFSLSALNLAVMLILGRIKKEVPTEDEENPPEDDDSDEGDWQRDAT